MSSRDGHPAKACSSWSALLRLRSAPIAPSARASLAMALEALGRCDAAIEAYRAGLAVAPDSMTLRLSLASALLAAGRLDETVDVVDEASRFHAPADLASYYGAAARHRPEAPVPRLGLVRAWTALADRDRARDELERLRRLAPGLADLAAARGGL